MTQPKEPQVLGSDAALADKGVGEHVVADLYGIEPSRLRDETALTGLLGRALEQAGFHVLSHTGHTFPGMGAGVTIMFLLSESHAAIHTYPESEYAALDVFSCGAARPDAVIAAVRTALAPQRVQIQRLTRGEGVSGHGV